jgi:N-acetylglucosaminyldiphosphoundecaprenol N-acetyl-beta-D-mannosaminyltransferase
MVGVQNIQSFNLIGLRINPVKHEQILAQMDEWIRAGSYGHTIVVANTHVVMESRQNPALGKASAAASLVIPDGMPLVIAARSRGYPLQVRSDGPGLLQKALTFENCQTWRHYFLGGTPEVLSALCERYQQAQIAGIFAPPFRPLTDEEDKHVVDEINASHPDVLWVSLGCPKQEQWVFEHASRLDVPVILGVGQAFDILSGFKKRAPNWMCVLGLEWFFRLMLEPRRLWKRYLLYNPWFIWLYMWEQVGLIFHPIKKDSLEKIH